MPVVVDQNVPSKTAIFVSTQSAFDELDVLVANYGEKEETIRAGNKLLNDIVEMEKLPQI